MKLVFPVAGEGSRFGGVFKPFLKIGDKHFIEVTYEPFAKWQDHIDGVYFICTEEQDQQFSVEARLKEIIPHKNVNVIKLKNKTNGPYETIKESNLSGSCIVCDCDHSLDVDPIFEKISNDIDCIIPVWEYHPDEYYNWSKVVSDGDDIKMICEKEKIESEDFEVSGIIGCIYFKNIESFSEKGVYVSDCLSKMLKDNKVMKKVRINKAHFYGDPEMLQRHVDYRRKLCTVFCDIDGTLIKHDDHSTCDLDNAELLSGVKNLKTWKDDDHKIILTTARSEKTRSDVVKFLEKLGIVYDELIMGLPSGPRVVINDRKPSKPFTQQAASAEITRDAGIENIVISDYTKNSEDRVIKNLSGNSFAETFLIEKDSKLFVRKRVLKSPENEIHYKKLKRQVVDLERLQAMKTNITPKVINSGVDNPYEFYYDMEYLEGYETLASLDEQEKYIDDLLTVMDEHIYSHKNEVDGLEWLNKHLKNKIYPKLEMYAKDSDYKNLVESDRVVINGKDYHGIKTVLEKINKKFVKPKFVRPIHGDFTLENVMVKNNDIKLIDMDGADYVDAAELDLGKMCQSLISKYSEWKDLDDLKIKVGHSYECTDDFFNLDMNCNKTLRKWSSILKEDAQTTLLKGMYFMSMYFIRFVPFREAINKDHGVFALIMATVWLNKVLQENSDG